MYVKHLLKIRNNDFLVKVVSAASQQHKFGQAKLE